MLLYDEKITLEFVKHFYQIRICKPSRRRMENVSSRKSTGRVFAEKLRSGKGDAGKNYDGDSADFDEDQGGRDNVDSGGDDSRGTIKPSSMSVVANAKKTTIKRLNMFANNKNKKLRHKWNDGKKYLPLRVGL